MSRIPVTVLTGFLGSGKTTLLNRILKEEHGQRIAVIENEFGEVGIDQDLVLNADEEIMEMNNGCICCTVRGDLIRILNKLMDQEQKIDRVIIETTGMADPGPVAQTFFVDASVREKFELDGVITLVDAAHVTRHWDSSEEVLAQIAFADLILLNKKDLVTDQALKDISRRLSHINAAADILPVTMGETDIRDLLGLGGFDLERALELKPQFLEPEYPFEWGGIFNLPEGKATLCLRKGADPSMTVLLARVEEVSEAALSAAAGQLFIHFSEKPTPLRHGELLVPGGICWQLDLEGQEPFVFELGVPSAGSYVLLMEHMPHEFEVVVRDAQSALIEPAVSHTYNPEHTHDNTVSSVSVEIPGSLDENKLELFLNLLIQTKGEDIFRMKGILSINEEENRYLFQGVHMLLSIAPAEPWGDAPRYSRMVFIGRNLDSDYLQEAFLSCRV